MKVIHTPGHTLDSICLLISDKETFIKQILADLSEKPTSMLKMITQNTKKYIDLKSVI